MQGTLYPYYDTGVKKECRCWVFDDPSQDLKAEAFVMGMSEMIEVIVRANRIPKARKGFAMTFSDEPIEGADVHLYWVRGGKVIFTDSKTGKKKEYMAGNWYEGVLVGNYMEGWLCPALLKYFPEAPKEIWAKASPLPAGIDPIWRNPPPKKTAYVMSDDELKAFIEGEVTLA